MDEPNSLYSTACLYIRQCWTQLCLWSELANSRRGDCEAIQLDGEAEIRRSRRVLQCSQPHQPWHAQPLCEHFGIQHDHVGDDPGPPDPGERQNIVLGRCCIERCAMLGKLCSSSILSAWLTLRSRKLT